MKIPLSLVLVLFALSLPSGAAPLPVKRSQFQGEDFVKSFIGSYGILSPVEPKLDAEEAEFLVELSGLFEQGRFREVESALVNFIKARQNPLDPAVAAKEVSPTMIFNLGNLYLQQNRLEEAERSYKLAIKGHKTYRRAYKNLGMLYAMKEDMDRAYLNLKEAISLGDADHRSYGLIGHYYLQKGRAVAAEGAFRQAYLLNPDDAEWKKGLGQAFLLQEKWEEAAALLDELIQDFPNDPNHWLRQASCFVEMDQKMRAATNFEILRRKGLATAETLDKLGNIYMDQEQPMLALGAYLAAMQKTEQLDVKRALKTAKILLAYGAPEEAAQYIEAVQAREGEALPLEQLTDLLLVEAEAARASGDEARVGELLDRILEIKPGDGQALVQRGMHLEEVAKNAADPDGQERLYAKASTSFRLALEKPEVAYQANLRYGQMLVRQRKFLEALPFLKVALELEPSDNLTQYVRRVERPAARQKERQEREEREQAEAAARNEAQEKAAEADKDANAPGKEEEK